jgi:hypothetical protein
VAKRTAIAPECERNGQLRIEAIIMIRIPHELPEEFPQEAKFMKRL